MLVHLSFQLHSSLDSLRQFKFTYFRNVELLVFFKLAFVFPDGDLGFVLDCLQQIVLLCEGFLNLGVDLLFLLKESLYVLVHFIINNKTHD